MEASKIEILFFLQKMYHFLKQVSYCLTELSDRDANMMWIDAGGMLLLSRDSRIRLRQPG